MKKKLLLIGLIATLSTLEACSSETSTTQSSEIESTLAETNTSKATEAESSGDEAAQSLETLAEAEPEILTTDPSNILTTAPVQTSPVLNGSRTETIGTRAYVNILKDDLKNVTTEQYTVFVNSVVKSSDYNWFTIICEDGTGICFPGSTGVVATYGQLDGEGCVSETIGNIVLTENDCTYKPSN